MKQVLAYGVDIRRFLENDTRYGFEPIMGETNLAQTETMVDKPLVIKTQEAQRQGYWGKGRDWDPERAEADIRRIGKGVEFNGQKYCLEFGHSNWLRVGKLGFMPENQTIMEGVGCDIATFKAKKGLKFDLYKGLNFRPAMAWSNFKPDRVAIIGDDEYKEIFDCLFVDGKAEVTVRKMAVKGDNTDGTCVCDPSMAPTPAKKVGFFQFVAQPAAKGACRILNKKAWSGVTVIDPLFGGEMELTDYDMIMPLSVFKCHNGYAGNAAGMAKWRSEARACFMMPSSKSAKLNWQGMQSLLLNGEQLRALAANALNDFSEWRNGKEMGGMNDRAVMEAVGQMTDIETISPKMVAEKVSFLARAKAKNLRCGRWLQPDRKAKRLYLGGEMFFENINLAADEVCCNGLPEGKIALLRNPHVSAFEWVVVNNRHHRNGARGVCILPRNTQLWACLSGADGDGDQVIATSDSIIVNAVMRITQGRNMPIQFDVPKPTKGDLIQATVGELVNTAYQNACNTAGKFYWNFGQNAAARKLVLKMGIVCSATTMVGVDAGKYQYEVNPAWGVACEAAAKELQILAGVNPKYCRKLINLPMSPAHFFQHTKLEKSGYEYPTEFENYGGKGYFKGATQKAVDYSGVIGKTKDGVVFELDASRVIFDTVERDSNGNAIKGKRMSVRGADAKVIEANWETVQTWWANAKLTKAAELVTDEEGEEE